MAANTVRADGASSKRSKNEMTNPKPLPVDQRRAEQQRIAEFRQEHPYSLQRDTEREKRLSADARETGSLFDAPIERDDPVRDAAESAWLNGFDLTDFDERDDVSRDDQDRLDRALKRRGFPEPGKANPRVYLQTNEAKLEHHAWRAKDRGSRATLTEQQWSELVAAYEQRCAYCGLWCRVPTIEHVVPIARGGGHTLWNVLPSCQWCNREKGTLNLLQWKREDDWFWVKFLERYRDAAERVGRAKSKRRPGR
jgi:5-methylcytosine-specific restriction endonuclease McrA